MTTTVALIGGCALITIAIRAVGPLALSARELPDSLSRVIALLTPALLAALVATQSLAHGSQLVVDTRTAGVAAGGLVAWRWGSLTASLVAAIGVTALLRAV